MVKPQRPRRTWHTVASVHILLLTQIVPFPPDSGPKIKTYNVLRYLAQRHAVHLISFVRPGPEAEHARSLRAICASVTPVPLKRSRVRDIFFLARSGVSGRPFLIERDDLANMRRAVRQVLHQHSFDAVHADQLTMGQFAVDLPLSVRVLDEHNAVWTIVRRAALHEPWWRRPVAELEWHKLRAYEGALCARFDAVTVVSDTDRIDLEQAAEQPLTTLEIPIAIDPVELPFEPRGPAARGILSLATMFYPPNVEGVHWFATEVLPLVRADLPTIIFRIVGSRPPAQIQQLGTATSAIEVTGYVADVTGILRQSGVLVVPLHSGSGMRVKILEAFARGIPVVSTSIGVEGIEAVPGEHLLVADTPAEFAAAVTRILCEPKMAARLAYAARTLVERRYDWHTALSPLDGLYPPAST